MPQQQQQQPALSASVSVGQLLAARRKSLVVPPVLDYAGGLDGRARSSSGAAGTAVHGGHSAPRRSASMAAGGHAAAAAVDVAPSPDALVAVPLHYNDPLAGADVASLQEFLAAHPHARLIGRHPALAPPFRVRNRFVSRVHLVVEHFAVEESITLRAVIRDRFQRMEGTIRGHPEVALGNPNTTLEAGFERRRAKVTDSQRTKVMKAAAAQRFRARPASKKWPPSSDEDNDSSNSNEDDVELRHDKKFAALLNRRLQAMLSLMVPASAAADDADDDDGTGEHPTDSGAWRPTELVSNGRITLVTNVGNSPVFVGDVRMIPGVPFPIRANDVVSLLEAPAAAPPGAGEEAQPAASFTAAPYTPSPVRAVGRPQPVGARRSRSYSGL